MGVAAGAGIDSSTTDSAAGVSWALREVSRLTLGRYFLRKALKAGFSVGWDSVILGPLQLVNDYLKWVSKVWFTQVFEQYALTDGFFEDF